MNPLAEELNAKINSANPGLLTMFSNLGLRMYFPKGILYQSGQAKQKAHKYNATVGVASTNNRPLYLNNIDEMLVGMEPENVYPYAPPAGKEELRKLWREKLIKDNPMLSNKQFSSPLVTSGITSGISLMSDLFINKGDVLICPDKYWGNYNLICGVKNEAVISTYPTYDQSNNYNISGLNSLINSLVQKGHQKLTIMLNFPNNPTGYNVKENEAKEIAEVINNYAQKNIKIICITDDAYFGLVYDDSIKCSMFSYLADLHKNVLAIKLDGATKEEYVWGFRVGFLTYSTKCESEIAYNNVFYALEEKTKGVLRAAYSSCCHLSQSMVIKSLKNSKHDQEKTNNFNILKRRADKTKEIFSSNQYKDEFIPYPFNSGYFMCIKLLNVNAEKLRLYLLDKYGIGLISINDTDLRITFASIEEENILDLFNTIYKGCQEIK